MKLRLWKRVVRGFLADWSGATAVEYGLIAAGIAAVILGAMTTVGSEVNTTYDTISTNVAAAIR
jgi:pilus assembly protein Flp/PilA